MIGMRTRLEVADNSGARRLRCILPRGGNTGAGLPIPQTDLFGYFAVPALTSNPDNPEIFVKLLDGRGANGHYWFFHGGLTDFEAILTVRDTQTGEARTYTKQGGSFCGGADP